MHIYSLKPYTTGPLPADLSFHVVTTLTQLKEAANGQADVLIAEEHEAIQLMHTLQGSDTKVDVVALVPDRMSAVRLSILGVTHQWLHDEWEQQLMHTYGESKAKRAAAPKPTKIPQVVAVASTYAGNGSTHTALMMGKYLQSVHFDRVAVVEAVQGAEAFTVLQQINSLPVDMTTRYGARFTYEDVTMICQGMNASQLERITEDTTFDAVVLDLGVLQHLQSPGLFFEADLPLLLTASAPWRMVQTIDSLTKFSSWPQQDVRMVIPQGTNEDWEEVSSTFEMHTTHNLPHHPDPFALHPDTMHQLHRLVSPIAKIPKRQHRIMGL